MHVVPLFARTTVSENLVEATGLEPATVCLQGRCSSKLSYAPIRGIAWTYPDSNREPLPCHGIALPLELQAHCAGVRSLYPASQLP